MKQVAQQIRNESEPTQLTKLEQFVAAALTGVVASDSQKFDCCNNRQSARKAIEIAKEVMRQLDDGGAS